MLKKLSGAMLLAVLSSSTAATTITGSIQGDDAWGFIQFDHAGGALTIDILASGWVGGPTGVGIDDPFLTLHRDDGSPFTAFTGAFVTSNDDSNPADGLDASSSWLDSLIVLGNLAADSYLLSISHWGWTFAGNANDWSGIHAPYLDYQVTFSQEVTVTAIDGAPVNQVPEPASLALMGLALAGMGVARRRNAG